MTEIFEEIYLIFRVALVIGFIMFVVWGIVREASIRTQAIVFLSVSGGLLLVFCGAFLIDKFVIEYSYPIRVYFYFMGVCLIFVVLSLIKLFKTKKIAVSKKKTMIYTYHEKEEYLYVIYRYEDCLYLLNDTYSGIKYKMRKNEFTDDVIRKVNSGFNINIPDECERTGIITVKGDKVDTVFYCYLINLNSPIYDETLTKVNVYNVGKKDILDFDKFVILKCLTSNNFDETY